MHALDSRETWNDADLLAALRRIFGYTSFRPQQRDIIRGILDGRDSLSIMPTGGGKSLCFQLPAALRDGVCVVISPLISLMKDQVDAACANGLRAAALNSSLDAAGRGAVHAALREGALDLLYISPERLNVPGFWDTLAALPLAFFAIDEAHCISQWGHDFRPDYLALSGLVERFPGCPVAAFTATATPEVERDILQRLGLRDPLLIRSSFDRPNLFYHVQPKENVHAQLTAFLERHAGESGIVYRSTRKKVEETAAFLQKKGFRAGCYHAGLGDAERARAQEAFRRDECPLMVATVAFGMGIDKPDVRFVAHLDLPKNLESYYQETGRAGRDGDPAHCLLLYSPADMAQLLYFARQSEDEDQRAVAERQAYAMLDYADRNECRRKTLLAYCGEAYQAPCGGCDVCTGEIREEDYTIEAQKALSAMVRSGCRFGRVLIMDILMGADSRRIRETGFHSLPTYGVGKDRSRRFWRYLIDALLRHGLAATEGEDYPVLRVTEAGWETLRGKNPFRALRIVETRAKRTREKTAADPGSADESLFQRLREERRRLAEAAQVPPYVIFHDRALREMAARKPASPEELLDVPGVGEKKLRQYGEAFLAAIAAHVSETDVSAATPDPVSAASA